MVQVIFFSCKHLSYLKAATVKIVYIMAHHRSKLDLFKELVECFLIKFVNTELYHSEEEKRLASARLERVLFKSIFKFFDTGFTEVCMETALKSTINEMRAVGKQDEAEKLTVCVKQLPHKNKQILDKYQIILRFLIGLADTGERDEQVSLVSSLSSSLESEVDYVEPSSQGNHIWYNQSSSQNTADLLLYSQELFENISMQVMTESDVQLLTCMLCEPLHLHRHSGHIPHAFVPTGDFDPKVPVGVLPYEELMVLSSNSNRMELSHTFSFRSDINGSIDEIASDDDEASAEIPLHDSSRSSGMWSSDSMSITFPSIPSDNEQSYASIIEMRNLIGNNRILSEKAQSSDQSTLSSSSSSTSSNFTIDFGEKFLLASESAPLMTWEDRGRPRIVVGREHCYATETGSEAFDVVVECVDALHINPVSDIFPPNLLVADDVKNLLIGISSSSFIVKKQLGGSVQILLGPRLSRFGGYFYSYASALFDMCKWYISLKEFSEAFQTENLISEALVIKAAKFAVQKYLWFYETTVMSCHVIEFPQPVEYFTRIFSGLRNHLRCIIEFCELIDKIKPTANNILSVLCQLVECSNFNQPYNVSLMLIVKHCFQPYFSFLEHWLFEGSADDYTVEFNIKVSKTFASAKDETFWTRCFMYEVEGDESVTPHFLKEIAMDVFVCGKSYNLLRRCCPNHHMFSANTSLPVFSLGFSHKRISLIEKKNIVTMIKRITVMLENLEIPAREDSYSSLSPEELSNTDSVKKLCQDATAVARKRAMLVQMKNELIVLLENMHIHISNIEAYESAPVSDACKRFDTVEIIKKEDEERFLLEEYCYVEEEQPITYFTGDQISDSLIAKVAAYLHDNWGDTKDVIDYLQEQHMSDAVNRSIFSLARSQIDLVNRCVLDFYFVDENLNKHFEELTKFFFLRDGDFGHLLCQGILAMINAPETESTHMSYCFSPIKLHAVLQGALPDNPGPSTELLSLHAKNSIKDFSRSELNFVEHLQLLYSVGFPCNIIINEDHMAKYNKILIQLLQIQLPLSRLGVMWFHLKNLSTKNTAVVNSAQYRKLQLCRHEMLHFLNVIKAYINYMTLEVLWVQFQADINENVKNIDDLRRAHDAHVERAVKVCLLSHSDKPLQILLREILNSILLFNKFVTEGEWLYNDSSKQWEHTAFRHTMTYFENFKANQDVFFQAYVDIFQKKEFLVHMICFVTLFNFNLFYGNT